MANKPESTGAPKHRFGPEDMDEDPHYHDDDEIVPLDEDRDPHSARPPSGRKTARRLPPPKRRFYEE